MNSPPSTHMLSTCFWMVLGDRSDAARYSRKGRNRTHQLLARRQIFFQPHPRAGPAVQIPAVMFQVVAWRSGGAVYFGSSRRRHFPLHAAAHHDSKPLPPLSGIRLSAGPLQFRSQEH